jgi:flagellar biogenesis protein FliO
MQERVKDVTNLDALLLEEFVEAEIEKDEVEIEKEGWSFHIVRIVAILILILIIIWGIMKIF